MASPTQWTCVCANSRNWWWTGRSGMLQFMGSQRVRHNWATELNWIQWNIILTKYYIYTADQTVPFLAIGSSGYPNMPQSFLEHLFTFWNHNIFQTHVFSLPHLWNQSFFQLSLLPFINKWYLETKICLLVVHTTWRPSQWTELGNLLFISISYVLCMYTAMSSYRHLWFWFNAPGLILSFLLSICVTYFPHSERFTSHCSKWIYLIFLSHKVVSELLFHIPYGGGWVLTRAYLYIVPLYLALHCTAEIPFSKVSLVVFFPPT